MGVVKIMNTTKPLWQRSIPCGLMSSGQIHIWRACLDLHSSQIEKLLLTLSLDEVERASRFRFEKDKKRFIAARGMLRNILAGYLQTNAQKIQFEYTRHGKPKIATKDGHGAVRFSVSHSGAFVLYAVTLHRDIGVDIELIRHDVAVAEIAKKFFSQREVNSLESTNSNNLHRLFFQYWTRKEAILKAMGEGFSFPMDKIDVSLIAGSDAGCVTLPAHEEQSWYIQDLFPAPGYTGSFAIPDGHCHLSYLEYSI
jgi:4'-phosphopantetheinyl transferase